MIDWKQGRPEVIVIDGRALLIIAAIMGLIIYEKCKFEIWNDRRKERNREKAARRVQALLVPHSRGYFL
jgi:hypothetical protein